MTEIDPAQPVSRENLIGANRDRTQLNFAHATGSDYVLRTIMPGLFDPLTVRDLTFTNRVFVSPMCQYSSVDGYANEWHLVHLGSRAVGGAGLVFTEATAVLPEGRISPQDLGIWDDSHLRMLGQIVKFIHEQGSIAGM